MPFLTGLFTYILPINSLPDYPGFFSHNILTFREDKKRANAGGIPKAHYIFSFVQTSIEKEIYYWMYFLKKIPITGYRMWKYNVVGLKLHHPC